MFLRVKGFMNYRSILLEYSYLMSEYEMRR